MFAEDCCSVRESSNDHLPRRKDASTQSFCQRRSAGVGDADGSVPSPSAIPPSGDLVLATVNMTAFVDMFRLILDAW